LDVLVLITALSALLALGGLPVSGPGGPSMAACLRNLQVIAQTSALVAASDSRAILHRQSSAGFFGWRGLGRADWGGADGSDPYYGPNCGFPGSCLSANTRPYNNYLSPMQISKVFHCPADTGAADIPGNYVPAPSSGPNDYLTSVFQACGNSYHGDFLWFPGSQSQSSMRAGSFMRPAGLVSNPAETMLFYDTRFAQAYLSTTEAIDFGAGIGQAVFVPSWHEPTNRHNILLFDGHAAQVELNMTGSMIPMTSFPEDIYSHRNIMYRGTGWRYDAFPEEFVRENVVGDPLPRDTSTVAPAGQTPLCAPEHIADR